MLKKLFLTLAIFFSTTFISFACEYETKNISETGTTTLKLNIRNAPCAKGTTILSQTKIGENYQLIGEANDYYKIKYNGKNAFIWKKGVTIKNHNLSSLEEQAIKKIVTKIQKESKSKQKHFLKTVRNLQTTTKKNSRNHIILTTLIDNLEEKNSSTNTKNTVQVPNKNQSSESEEVAKYWLSLYNNYRKKIGVHEYRYDNRLQHSAEVWSKISADRGYWSHKREKGDSFYDFWKIQDWFKNNDVHCKIQNRTAAVENVGVGVMYCKKDNCTDELKKVVKRTFDFYMNEKGTSNDAHYRSIVSPYLHYMGFGIYKQKIGNGKYKVYNTTHFCTEFEN